ncbi:NAD(P)H-binding protein [Companilactobacillus formosensis]|uniref:NAD(P)H-binding protein n=1 Tax=Companilactobacillus formosensis TaxID=1617889 RepID=UPI000E64FBE7|nr:NAD(P)H-binding protein [Companilactobacillus formosensis]
MKNILIIGATSAMGELATKYFLNKTDDNITLMARYTNLLTIDEKRERVYQGDIIDKDVLDAAMKGIDVVLVSLDSNEERLIQKIIEAMDRANVERFLFLTSMGICNEVPIYAGASGNLTERSILEPYQQVISRIEDSDLNYTIIRPSWLDDGSDIKNYQIDHNGKPFQVDTVSRNSVADLILRLASNDQLDARDNIAISRKI